MNNTKLLISFASYMAHVINGDDNVPDSMEEVELRLWELHQKITDLLCYPQYKPYKKRTYQHTPEYLYCLVGHQMATDQTAEISVARYFERVFEYIISNKKQLADTPTSKLVALFQAHRMDTRLAVHRDVAAISLWQIFEQAGKSRAGEAVIYRRWQAGEFIALCQHISDVFRTANRHYGEIFRMGLYPPDWMDVINVSQARKINQLLKPKRDADHADSERADWIAAARQRWDQYALKHIDGQQLDSFDDFLQTELGKCLTGQLQAKPVVISDYDFSQTSKPTGDPLSDPFSAQEDDHGDDFYTPDYDVAYDCNLRIERLSQLLDTQDIDKQDKAIILQVLHNQELALDTLATRKRYVALGLDESTYLDYLGELIHELLSD